MTAQGEKTHVRFTLHPRVFSALGQDLVTNDVVAIIELVKNAYDALATKVEVVIDEKNSSIAIRDNGTGMSLSILKKVWCVVATPYRLQRPRSKRGNLTRRAVGEKGLGRLSAARLGRRLIMYTKARSGRCWRVNVDWQALATAADLSQCTVTIQQVSGSHIPYPSGTILQITDLTSAWGESELTTLQENLERLVSPFERLRSFTVYLKTPASAEATEGRVTPQAFLSNPPYSFKGAFDSKGSITYDYDYKPLTGSPRHATASQQWETVRQQLTPTTLSPLTGPFTFELRAWDLGSDDLETIGQRYHLQRSLIRKSIKAYQGIALYRDRILVLPKSDEARDWLGLDLRRVSRTGTRLSTSQLIGYVAITAKSNPGIQDTSDRERLVTTRAVEQFRTLLTYIVGLLEIERSRDRSPKQPVTTTRDLLADLSPAPLIAGLTDLVRQGAMATDALPLVNTFSERVDSARKELERRLVYYSQLATVGTLAQLLVHEVRNKTMVIDTFLRKTSESRPTQAGSSRDRQLELAQSAVAALTKLADRFAPLASRGFRRGRRNAVVEEIARDAVDAHEAEVKRLGVVMDLPTTRHLAAVDPGELFAILDNLIDNALTWIGERKKREIAISTLCESGSPRIQVRGADSGPGIAEEDLERVFLPGVTRKPNGIGMGLTVAAELTTAYGGKMYLEQPGDLGGASFTFDLPNAENLKTSP